ADEPKLLAHDGEDEVGRLLGYEGEVGLGALAQALAGQASRGDGDLRLLQVVGGALRVHLRIEKGTQTVELILLEDTELDDGHDGDGRQQEEHGDVAQTGTGNDEDADED